MEANNIEKRLGNLEQKLDLLTTYLMKGEMPVEKETEVENQQQVSADTVEEVKTQPTVVNGRLEEQLNFVREARKDCQDKHFRKYLDEMEHRLINESTKIDEIAANIQRNYKTYLSRNPEIQLKKGTAAVASPVNVPEMPVRREPVRQPLQPAMDMTPLEAEPKKPEVQPASAPVKKTEAAQKWDRKVQQESSKESRNGFGTKEGKKLDLEFGIGGALLSVVGALFIIAAFVIFGMNYMGSFAQGALLYVLGIVVIVFSEMVIKKSLEKFSQAMTALGIGILYTATILNYLYLHTINAGIAIVMTVVVALVSLFLSQKRESSALRLVGIIGAYISFAPITEFKSVVDFIIPCVMVLIINGIYLFLPIQNGKKVVANVHAVANVLFALPMAIIAVESDISKWPIIIFVLVAIMMTYLIYRAVEMGAASITIFTICLTFLSIDLIDILYKWDLALVGVILYALVIAGGTYVVRKQKSRMVGLYLFSVAAPLIMQGVHDKYGIVAVAVVLLIYKVLASMEELRVANIIYSLVAAIVFISAVADGIAIGYLILAVFVVSVVTMKYDKLVHALMLIAILQIFPFVAFEFEIALPLVFVLLLLCFVFFTFVDLFSMKGNKVFGTILFVWDVMLILMLAVLDHGGALTVCMVAQLAFLFIYFSEKSGYCSEGFRKARYLFSMIYLTYMVFIFDIEIPLVTSIVLMLLGIASVAIGFFFKQKGVRIYGLCLAFFVCFKLLLVDFRGQQSSDRVLLFFFVGILAMAISYLYMRIERNLRKEEENERVMEQARAQASMHAQAAPLVMPSAPIDFEMQPDQMQPDSLMPIDEQPTTEENQPIMDDDQPMSVADQSIIGGDDVDEN